jgi:hypothetical protein
MAGRAGASGRPDGAHAPVAAASPALRWLTPRMEGAPGELRKRMLDATAWSGAPDIANSRALLAAALTCLDDALELGNERAAALELLAADALLTAACEAAAEEDDMSAFVVEASAQLARRVGPAGE